MRARTLIAVFFLTVTVAVVANEKVPQTPDQGEEIHQIDSDEHTIASHEAPANWSVVPFVLLLVMIATGPLFYPHFWHKSYPAISVGLGIMVMFYYVFILHNEHGPVHSAAEYIQFIALADRDCMLPQEES